VVMICLEMKLLKQCPGDTRGEEGIPCHINALLENKVAKTVSRRQARRRTSSDRLPQPDL
jgi:hypothetical protein